MPEPFLFNTVRYYSVGSLLPRWYKPFVGRVIERKTKMTEEESEVEAPQKLLLFSFLLGAHSQIVSAGSFLLFESTREVFSSSFAFNNLVPS